MKRLLWILTATWLLTACSNEELLGPEGFQNQQLPDLPILPDPDALPHVDDVMAVIDDPYFARYSLARFDSNGDGKLSMAEVERAERIIYDEDTPELQADYSRFISMKGIEYFKNLKALEIRSSVLMALDLSHNSNLRELRFEINQEQCHLKRLNVSHTNLEELQLPSSELEELLVSGSHLKKLDIQSTNGLLKSLDVRYCEDLEELYVSNSDIPSIDLRYCPHLTTLTIDKAPLSTIDLSQNGKLKQLAITETTINNINLSKNPEILDLNLCQNNLSRIDLSQLTKLQLLNLSSNPLGEVDLQNLVDIRSLFIAETNITTLNTDNNTNLTHLYCGKSKLASLDLTTNTKLQSLDCSDNNLTDISWSASNAIRLLSCENNLFTSLDFSDLAISWWKTSEKGNNSAYTYSTFAPQPNLEVLILAAYTKEVSMEQLSGCPKLRKVVLHATEIPELICEEEISPLNATLYVPSEAISAYESSTWAEVFMEVRSL